MIALAKLNFKKIKKELVPQTLQRENILRTVLSTIKNK